MTPDPKHQGKKLHTFIELARRWPLENEAWHTVETLLESLSQAFWRGDFPDDALGRHEDRMLRELVTADDLLEGGPMPGLEQILPTPFLEGVNPRHDVYGLLCTDEDSNTVKLTYLKRGRDETIAALANTSWSQFGEKEQAVIRNVAITAEALGHWYRNQRINLLAGLVKEDAGAPQPSSRRTETQASPRMPRDDGTPNFTIGEIAVRILETHRSSPSVDLKNVIGWLLEQVEPSNQLCPSFQDVPASEDGGVSEFWWKYYGDKENKSVVERGDLVSVSTEEMTRFCDSAAFREWATSRGLGVPASFDGKAAPAQEEPPAKGNQQIPAPDPTQGNKRPYFKSLCEVVRDHYDILNEARSQDLRGDMLRKLMAKKGEKAKGFPKTRQARHRAYQDAEDHLEKVSLLPEPKPLTE